MDTANTPSDGDDVGLTESLNAKPRNPESLQ